ncbi:protoheme ferro-lyase [Candidatus Scalindua japonica]|uniref:Protoheme ferro-lyase n=1 Tax=Candidatus Scalindua japonica TaxID=1284222 RepID=A0A286U2P5_9BACT|nr:hypothetical protein [Candidatus Scalindua japonica]GAX62397.1 protoheme ferro-lyase [Candidatus Scalindua japonica]
MIIKMVSIISAVLLVGLFITLKAFASELKEPDPSFKLAATLSPIDGGQLYVGDIDRKKKTFRLHLRHIGKDSNWVYYYENASAFVNEDGYVELDNAQASIVYPQYTFSIIGNTFRKATVRILFNPRDDGKGFFKEAGQVIYQQCATNTFEAKNWKCTGWEYLGTLPGF